MKVDLVIDHLDHGGSQEQTVTLAQGLAASGVEVRVLAVTAGGVLTSRLEGSRIPCLVFGKRFKGDVGVVSRLAAAMRTHRPDVVVTVIFTAGFYGRLAAFRAGVPTIVKAEHGIDPDKGLLHIAIDRRLARRTHSIVANCEAVAAAVARRDRVDPARLHVITNGLDPGRFRPAELPDLSAEGVPPEAPVVLFAGRLAREKGIARLGRVLSLLLARDPLCHVLVAGDGPERTRLERRLRAHAARCHLLGARDDVPRLLARASVMLLTSLTEGLPGVLLEAQAAEVPVVAADVGGVREAVVDGESGFLVTPGNESEMAARVTQLLIDPSLAARLGAAGRQHVSERFTRDRMVSRWLEHLRELVSAHGGAASPA